VEADLTTEEEDEEAAEVEEEDDLEEVEEEEVHDSLPIVSRHRVAEGIPAAWIRGTPCSSS